MLETVGIIKSRKVSIFSLFVQSFDSGICEELNIRTVEAKGVLFGEHIGEVGRNF